MTTTCQPASKYGAITTASGGHTFDSKIEETRYWHLKADPTVKEIEVHPSFVIFPAFLKCLPCGVVIKKVAESLSRVERCPHCKKRLSSFPATEYTPDFKVTYQDGHIEIEDVKGVETTDFMMRWKLFECAYPDLTLTVVRRGSKRTWLTRRKGGKWEVEGADRK